MITHVDFVRFRGFERLSAELAPHAYIVGPNSAGKSTVLEAIHLAEQCLKTARRKTASIVAEHKGRRWKAFPLSGSSDQQDDPVRHDFGPQETAVSVRWDTGASLNIVWPDESVQGDNPFFYVKEKDGGQPRTPAAVRSIFSQVTIVPVVTPLDRTEALKDPDYVEKHNSSRLASRHFRNHAWLMWRSDKWTPFKQFCASWVPEIELLDVSLDTIANRLSVFYSESGSRVPKELAWAGDGIQIWVQLLWHVFRAQGATTIVLDEPEVYLHPDLQRRLVRLLDGTSAQIILASHSADVIAEAPPEGVLWVDRRMGGAKRTRSQRSLGALSSSLGSSYNLALARSMRSRLVIASDCEDLRIIRALAKSVGAVGLSNEHTVSLVQLRERRNWTDLDQLGSSLREILPPRLPAVLLLQGGNRPKGLNEQIVNRLCSAGSTVVIWSRAELENYIIDADTVARISGAAPEAVSLRILEARLSLREITRAKFISEWVAAATAGAARGVAGDAEQAFDISWPQDDFQVTAVSGREIIKELNSYLESDGYRPISAYQLARNVRPQALAPEVIDVLFGMEEKLSQSF